MEIDDPNTETLKTKDTYDHLQTSTIENENGEDDKKNVTQLKDESNEESQIKESNNHSEKQDLENEIPKADEKDGNHPAVSLSIKIPQENDNKQETNESIENSFAKTKTSEISQNTITKSNLNENDLDEYDPDLFITDEERKAFEYMLEQRKEEIIKQKENFQNWVESITRRRMFALSRIRKVNLSHKSRMEFYTQIENHVRRADKLLANGSNDNEKGNPKEDTSEQFVDMVRENTGFVIKNDTHKSTNSEKNEEPNRKENNNNELSKGTNNVIRNAGQKDMPIAENVDDDSKHTLSNNIDTPKIVPVKS